MKALFALLLLVSAAPAFAKDGPRTTATPEFVAQFPAQLNCRSGALSSAVKEFSITGMNTVRPEASISDQGTMDDTVIYEDGSSGLTRVDLGFSNECDNGYGVQFYAEDLIALNAGSVTQIYGYLEYADVELGETTNGLVGEEHLTMTCTR